MPRVERTQSRISGAVEFTCEVGGIKVRGRLDAEGERYLTMSGRSPIKVAEARGVARAINAVCDAVLSEPVPEKP